MKVRLGTHLLFLGVCFVGSRAVSPPCPGLPNTDGLAITCMNPTTNATVECSSPNAVPRGTVALYKCQNENTGEDEETTLVCICKGRWKGIPKFNQVAEGCGGTKLSLSFGNANFTLASQTDSSGSLDQPMPNNSSTDVNGINAESGTTNGTITPMTALMMPLLPLSGNQSTTENGTINGGTICNCTNATNSSSVTNGTKTGGDEPGPAYNVVIDYDDESPSRSNTTNSSLTVGVSPIANAQDLSTTTAKFEINGTYAEPGPVYNVLHGNAVPRYDNNQTGMSVEGGMGAGSSEYNVTSNSPNTTSASATLNLQTVSTTPSADATSTFNDASSSSYSMFSSPSQLSSSAFPSDSSSSTPFSYIALSSSSTPSTSPSFSSTDPTATTLLPDSSSFSTSLDYSQSSSSLTPSDTTSASSSSTFSNSISSTPSPNFATNFTSSDPSSSTNTPASPVSSSSSQSFSSDTASSAPFTDSSSSTTSTSDLNNATSSLDSTTPPSSSASSLFSPDGGSSTETVITSTESLGASSTSTNGPTRNESTQTNYEPNMPTEKSGQVADQQTTSPSVEDNSIRESKNLNVENMRNDTTQEYPTTITPSTKNDMLTSIEPQFVTTTESSASSGGELKIISQPANNETASEPESSTPSNDSNATSTEDAGSSSPLPATVTSSEVQPSSTENSMPSSPLSSADPNMGSDTTTPAPGESVSKTSRIIPVGEVVTSPPLESSSVPPIADSTEGTTERISSSTQGAMEEPNSTLGTTDFSSSSTAASEPNVSATTDSNMTSSIPPPSDLQENSEVSSNFTDFQLKALELHNTLRQQHQSQPLKLNETLNKIAQDWADQEVEKSSLRVAPGKRSYAQNMYRVSGGDPLTKTEAVELAFKSWNSSAKYFDYENPKPTAFSQMVWNKTTSLGIGVAQSGSKSIVVATYSPRGNVVLVDKNSSLDPGYFFKQNVFPPRDLDTTQSQTTTESAFPSSTSVGTTSIGMAEEHTTSPPMAVSASLKLSVGGNTTASIGASSSA